MEEEKEKFKRTKTVFGNSFQTPLVHYRSISTNDFGLNNVGNADLADLLN